MNLELQNANYIAFLRLRQKRPPLENGGWIKSGEQLHHRNISHKIFISQKILINESSGDIIIIHLLSSMAHNEHKEKMERD